MPLTPERARPVSRQRAWPERAVAVALFAFGLVFLVEGRSYGVGTPNRMGPGYVPMVLGAVLCLLVMLIALRYCKTTTDEAVAWRAALMIAGGMATFALLLPVVGLMPALFLCTWMVSRADRRTTPVQSVIVASGLAVVGGLLFVQLLGLRIPLIWSGQ
jgi:hypothetical protein